MGLYERRCEREPIAVGQPDVNQEGVRREPLDHLPRNGGGFGLADNGVAASFQQLARNLPEDRGVIDDENASGQGSIVRRQGVAVKGDVISRATLRVDGLAGPALAQRRIASAIATSRLLRRSAGGLEPRVGEASPHVVDRRLRSRFIPSR